MSREIKFRYWNGVKMQITDFHITCFGIVWKDDDDRDGYVEDCILMQFTGFKDRTGVDIYEGDVIFIESHYDNDLRVKSYKAKVVFEFGAFDLDQVIGYDLCMLANNKMCEVIGNIYQNPELLCEISTSPVTAPAKSNA